MTRDELRTAILLDLAVHSFRFYPDGISLMLRETAESIPEVAILEAKGTDQVALVLRKVREA